MTLFYALLFLIGGAPIIMLVKNWRQAILRSRVAQALQNFQENTQAQIEDYFKSKKWPIPQNFGTKLAVMEERGLLSWEKGNKEKSSIVYKLTEPGKELLPKPKKVETPAVTPTFAAKEFQRKQK